MMKHRTFTASLVIIGLLALLFSSVVDSEMIGDDATYDESFVLYNWVKKNVDWSISPSGTLRAEYTNRSNTSMKLSLILDVPSTRVYTIRLSMKARHLEYTVLNKNITLSYGGYSVYFNYSDIPGGWTFNRGIKDGLMWFTASRNIPGPSHYVVDPIFGGYAGASTYYSNIANRVTGYSATPTLYGEAKYVKALINTSASVSFPIKVKGALYKWVSGTTYSFYAETEEKTIPASRTTQYWEVFNFSGCVNITPVKYLVVLWANNTLRLAHYSFPLASELYSGDTYDGTWTTPLVMSSLANYVPCVYCYYEQDTMHIDNVIPVDGANATMGLLDCVNVSCNITVDRADTFPVDVGFIGISNLSLLEVKNNISLFWPDPPSNNPSLMLGGINDWYVNDSSYPKYFILTFNDPVDICKYRGRSRTASDPTDVEVSIWDSAWNMLYDNPHIYNWINTIIWAEFSVVPTVKDAKYMIVTVLDTEPTTDYLRWGRATGGKMDGFDVFTGGDWIFFGNQTVNNNCTFYGDALDWTWLNPPGKYTVYAQAYNSSCTSLGSRYVSEVVTFNVTGFYVPSISVIYDRYARLFNTAFIIGVFSAFFLFLLWSKRRRKKTGV